MLGRSPACVSEQSAFPKIETVTLKLTSMLPELCGENDLESVEVKRVESGFTLIELLLVISIILTICAMAVPSLLAAILDAKIAAAVGDIHTMETEISQYDILNNTLPPDLAAIGRPNFLDPWGNPYEYLNHS